MPAAKTRRQRLPAGWMGKSSRRWLVERARESQHLIEVGCWLGRSTLVMARATPGKVWAVDTWEGTPQDPAQHEKLYAEFLKESNPYAAFCLNLALPIAAGKVVPIRGKSVEAAQLLASRETIGVHAVPAAFDFVFIDADHSYEGCAGDIAAFLPLVRSGGILAGHDYHWPGVQQAVSELLSPTREVALGPSSIWSIHV